MTDRAVYALVLAGGKSRRMGRDKAQLVHEGKPQLARTAELLAPLVDEVWVSVRKDQPADPLRDAYPQIVDRDDNAGPVAGILAALDTHPGVDWLVVAVDLPNLDTATLRYLLDHASDPRFTAYRSVRDNLPEPLCALYRPAAAAEIRRYVTDGIVCPRKILIQSDAELLEQPSPGALENINTPEDLALVGRNESAA